MKYPQINATAPVESKHTYADGAVYLTPANAAAVEAALSAEAPANSEVEALNQQLSTANENLATAQSQIANLQAQNATLQARVTQLEEMPAANNAAALSTAAQDDQPEQPAGKEPEWNDPTLAHNKAAADLGLF